MRSEQETARAIELHADTVRRLCLIHLKNQADSEDVFQNVFLKYALADDKVFADEEHRKAWLIRVATNTCRDMQRRVAWNAPSLEAEGCTADAPVSSDPAVQPDSRIAEVLDAMNNLDDPPRTPVYLALYEGYTAPEIATMMDAPVNTVYSWIARGKKTLKEALQ